MTEAIYLQGRASKKNLLEKVKENPVPYFIGFWLILNLVQGYFMELTSDEGYYWFYTKHLQWGYYDHPPMVALMIKTGSYLFPGELGIRFFNIVFSTASLYLFFTLLPYDLKRKKRTYFVLLSAPLLHYLAFIVFPDGPLLFFSLLFLVLYKRFLNKKNLSLAILLGISLALMAYSKYHGALVLLFTLIANPKLFRSGYLYVSLLTALILFIPHLWWQYKHNFHTLQYDLSGRTNNFSFRHVGEYISQQIVVIGPGLIFIAFLIKTNDVFERTLKFIVVGVFLFFLLSSFKAFIHLHWTSIAIYPLLYFAITYYNNPGKNKLYKSLILPFFIFLFLARFLLTIPILESMHLSMDYYHNRKKWAEEISNIAGEKPVFFPDNLREAPLYSFYSGKSGVTLFTYPEKKSQYDMWNYEDSLQGKNILLVTKYSYPGSTELETRMKQKIYYAPISVFRSYYSGIELKTTFHSYHFNDTILNVTVEMVNHRNTVVFFQPNDNDMTAAIIYVVKKNNKIIKDEILQQLTIADNLQPGISIKKTFTIQLKDLPKDGYKIYFGIRNGILPDALLSIPSNIN